MTLRVGYLTGTFDTFHEAHIRFLKRARSQCDMLIVGVTTDEVAQRQKRVPTFSFEHRRAVVDACRYVDVAVEHHGLSKEEDQRRLGFDVLFSGAEYVDSEEFKNYDKTKVVFLPRQNMVSSTAILQGIQMRVTDEMKIIAIGVQGHPVYRLGSMVIKEIRVTGKEIGNTADVHTLPFPRPRNWKVPGAVHCHPNIPGVNPNREIMIPRFLPRAPWNPFLQSYRKYADQSTEIYWLVQRFGGETLESKWKRYSGKQKNEAIDRVKEACADLAGAGVVHGDIHLDNVCADEEGNITLIDFGWCMHEGFDLHKNEKDELRTQLSRQWDFSHFFDSISWSESL